MPQRNKSLTEIKRDIVRHKDVLDRVHAARQAVRGYTTVSYDYPWPDGRGLIAFLGWKVGPWFDPTFDEKNYPNRNPKDLQVRHDIVVQFIDALNSMLTSLAGDPRYTGSLFHIDLRNTLLAKDEWANELHPGNAGFSKLAEKIDAALQANV